MYSIRESITKKLILILLIIFIDSPLFCQEKEPMKLVYFDSAVPYSWKDNGEMKGILVDILDNAINKRMGIPVIHKGYPWARVQWLVKAGKADAFFTVPTLKRIAYTEISKETIFSIDTRLFVKAKNLKLEKLKAVKTISDLRHFKIGSYLGSGSLKTTLKDMDVIVANNVELALKMLIMGRFDVFMAGTHSSLAILEKYGYKDEIVVLPNVLISKPFHLCIGKNSLFVGILSEFDTTIREMKEDGTLEKIFDKYK
ncbi:MAG: transporter substrate-binding domain-containing protein [Bacteroidales bacterium]|nr:transporter substrate-binding domain-containing protein [Bacteroidales bacterium]